jgi:small nuclear ribonucleoprotein (snRNP)-like protein
MNIFLGDVVSLAKEKDGRITMVTGQCSGLVLDDRGELERVYIHGLNVAFYMNEGWKFVEHEEGENEDGEI